MEFEDSGPVLKKKHMCDDCGQKIKTSKFSLDACHKKLFTKQPEHKGELDYKILSKNIEEYNTTKLDKTRHDKTRHNKTSRDKTRQNLNVQNLTFKRRDSGTWQGKLRREAETFKGERRYGEGKASRGRGGEREENRQGRRGGDGGRPSILHNQKTQKNTHGTLQNTRHTLLSI
jgi:hypothetical protein